MCFCRSMKTIGTSQVQVFLIDEDEARRDKYIRSLNADRHTICEGFESVEGGLSELANKQPDMIVLAYGILTARGSAILQRIRDYNPFIDVVLLPGPSYADAMEKLTRLSGYAYHRRESTDYVLDYLLTILARTCRGKRQHKLPKD